jgi:hypothetical protein
VTSFSNSLQLFLPTTISSELFSPNIQTLQPKNSNESSTKADVSWFTSETNSAMSQQEIELEKASFFMVGLSDSTSSWEISWISWRMSWENTITFEPAKLLPHHRTTLAHLVPWVKIYTTTFVPAELLFHSLVLLVPGVQLNLSLSWIFLNHPVPWVLRRRTLIPALHHHSIKLAIAVSAPTRSFWKRIKNSARRTDFWAINFAGLIVSSQDYQREEMRTKRTTKMRMEESGDGCEAEREGEREIGKEERGVDCT